MRLGRGSLTEVIFPEFSITYWAHCIHLFDMILYSTIPSSTMIIIKEIVFHHVIPMLPSKSEQNFDWCGRNHFLSNSHLNHLLKSVWAFTKDMAGGFFLVFTAWKEFSQCSVDFQCIPKNHCIINWNTDTCSMKKGWTTISYQQDLWFKNLLNELSPMLCLSWVLHWVPWILHFVFHCLYNNHLIVFLLSLL